LGGLFLVVAARLGYTDVRHQAPGLTVAVVAFNLTLTMVVWMRIRGHDWRPTLEMAMPTVALAALVFGLAAFNLMSLPDVGAFCGLACVLMLAPMLFRLDMYSSAHHLGR
jgi:uncharacterized membrane protein YfcA